MPEGPEIALTAEILYNKLKNKTLVSFHFVSGRYADGRTKPNGFVQFNKNLPMTISKINSKGKLLWWKFKSENNVNWYMWNTFGLTGMWSFFEPNSWRATLTCSDGTIAYYSDQRNFGTFTFSDDADDLINKLSELAPDFLKNTDIDFDKLLTYNKPIVEVLTDQKKLGSGIGNYLVAEILYRAKLSPHRIASELNSGEISNLKHWVAYTIKLAYDSNNVGYMINLESESSKIGRKNYHPEIKFKKSDSEFRFEVYRQKLDPAGNKVTVEKRKGDRSIYWVKDVQK